MFSHLRLSIASLDQYFWFLYVSVLHHLLPKRACPSLPAPGAPCHLRPAPFSPHYRVPVCTTNLVILPLTTVCVGRVGCADEMGNFVTPHHIANWVGNFLCALGTIIACYYEMSFNRRKILIRYGHSWPHARLRWGQLRTVPFQKYQTCKSLQKCSSTVQQTVQYTQCLDYTLHIVNHEAIQ